MSLGIGAHTTMDTSWNLSFTHRDWANDDASVCLNEKLEMEQNLSNGSLYIKRISCFSLVSLLWWKSHHSAQLINYANPKNKLDKNYDGRNLESQKVFPFYKSIRDCVQVVLFPNYCTEHSHSQACQSMNNWRTRKFSHRCLFNKIQTNGKSKNHSQGNIRRHLENKND